MPHALEKLRVIDATSTIAGQYCGRMLADYGAQVVLAEPDQGCSLRRSPPFSEDGSESLLFFHLNIGKESVTLDPTSPGGFARLEKLASGFDVVLIDRGLDADALSGKAPRTVICTISDFGDSGVLSTWRGCELIHAALSGMMNHNGDIEHPPLFGCGQRAYYAAGVAAYIAVLSALYARPRIGRGQKVAVDVAETATSLWYPYATQYIYSGSLEHRGDDRQPLGYVRCRDAWIAFWIFNDRWQAACEALNAPDLIDDPRFSTPGPRIANWNALVELFQSRVAGDPADEVVARLGKARLVAAKSYRPIDLWTNGHLAERGFWEEVKTALGTRPILGPQFRMNATPRRIRGAAPRIGSANARIFGETGARGAA